MNKGMNDLPLPRAAPGGLRTGGSSHFLPLLGGVISIGGKAAAQRAAMLAAAVMSPACWHLGKRTDFCRNRSVSV